MPLPELFTLDQVAERFGWTRRKLIARLKSYRIPTIGSGAEGRLGESEVARLLQIERRHGEWALLSRGERIAAGKRRARAFRDAYEREQRAALLALLPPATPEMQAQIRKTMERSKRMREAHARRKLMRQLGSGPIKRIH